MGAKGKDALLWLLGAVIVVSFITTLTLSGANYIGQITFAISLILAFLWFKFTFNDVRKARKSSIEQGFEVIDLLPLNIRWAKFLAGKRFNKTRVAEAYEIHLRTKLPPPRKLIIGLEKDLAYLDTNMQGLFLWETKIAVPHRIRARIKQYENEGRAFWEQGGWPIPGLPTFKKENRKPLRHGAILIGGERVN